VKFPPKKPTKNKTSGVSSILTCQRKTTSIQKLHWEAKANHQSKERGCNALLGL